VDCKFLEICRQHSVSLSLIRQPRSLSIHPTVPCHQRYPSTQGGSPRRQNRNYYLYRCSDHIVLYGPARSVHFVKELYARTSAPHQNMPHLLVVDHRRSSPRPILPSDRFLRTCIIFIYQSVFPLRAFMSSVFRIVTRILT